MTDEKSTPELSQPYPCAREILRDAKQRCFLAAYAETGILTRAEKASGVSRRSHQRWLDDPEYAEAFEEAAAEATDRLEAAARQRAIEGTKKYLFTSRGEPVMDPRTDEQAFELVYSDRLLELMLRAHRPTQFRDRVSNEVSGPNGRPIQTEELPGSFTVEERAKEILDVFREAHARLSLQGRSEDATRMRQTLNGLEGVTRDE